MFTTTGDITSTRAELAAIEVVLTEMKSPLLQAKR